MHIPVLAKEVNELLNPKVGEIAVDCTLGGGGHAENILKKILPSGRLIGIDMDNERLEITKKELEIKYSNKIKYIHGNFRDLEKIIQESGLEKVNVILADLGFSSWQVDSDIRGLSFLDDEAKLDMRFDQSQGRTAAELLNQSLEKEIADKIFFYGEEPKARLMAKKIIEMRKIQPFSIVKDLNNVAYKFYHHSKRHPATKLYQAMRIWVNDELESLKLLIPQAINILDKGGRLGIISFHSLEDRIVKWQFRDYQKNGIIKIITKRPIVPTDEEMKNNPRSRSAKFRVIEKI